MRPADRAAAPAAAAAAAARAAEASGGGEGMKVGGARRVVAVGRSAGAAEGAVAALNGKPERHIGAGILGKRAGERRRVAPPLQRGEQRALPPPPLAKVAAAAPPPRANRAPSCVLLGAARAERRRRKQRYEERAVERSPGSLVARGAASRTTRRPGEPWVGIPRHSAGLRRAI